MVRYLLGTVDVGPFFANQLEPNTVLVGAIQLGSHTIETWSVNQQVLSLWVRVYAWTHCQARAV